MSIWIQAQTYTIIFLRTVSYLVGKYRGGDIPAKTTIFASLNPSGGNDVKEYKLYKILPIRCKISSHL